MLLVIITALIPAVILGWWIYQKDSLRPEPLRQLILAFLLWRGFDVRHVGYHATLGYDGLVCL